MSWTCAGRPLETKDDAVMNADMMTTPQLGMRFAEVVRVMHATDGVRATAEAAVAAALQLVPGVSAAGVTLTRGRGVVTMEAVSHDGVRAADECEHATGRGPLTSLDEAELLTWGNLFGRRWGAWGPQAAELTGARSVLCVRLAARTNVGAMYLYSDVPDGFDAQARGDAMLLAQHAAAALDNAREIHTLRRAVLSRTTTATAVGILMARYRLDDERAFELLRRWSSHRNEKLRAVALAVMRQQVAHPSAEPDLGSLDVGEAPAAVPLTRATRSAQATTRASRPRPKRALRAS